MNGIRKINEIKQANRDKSLAFALDAAPRLVAFDFETYLIKGNQIPRAVCGAYCNGDETVLLNRTDALAKFAELILSNKILVGANIAFDLMVGIANGAVSIRQVFDKLDRSEIIDIQLIHKMDLIGFGMLGKDLNTGAPSEKYSLAEVTRQTLGRDDAKQNDFWRLRYALLEQVPIADWPEKAKQYPLDDAVNTYQCAMAQFGLLDRVGERRVCNNLFLAPEYVRQAFALEIGAKHGLSVDKEYTQKLIDSVQSELDENINRFVDLGYYRIDAKKGHVKNTAKIKAVVADAYGITEKCDRCLGAGKVSSEKTGKPINCKHCSGSGLDIAHKVNDAGDIIEYSKVPLTDKGAIQTGRDVLIDSDNPQLIALGEYTTKQKIVTTYGPALLDGLDFRVNLPLANERVSYRGVIQLMPRDYGVRESIRARDGYCLSSTDFGGIEMVTFAQACINFVGYSKLADALNGGADAHSRLGRRLSNLTYDEFVAKKKTDKKIANLRQAAKAGNFTFAGGGGIGAFVYAKRKDPGVKSTAKSGNVYSGIRFCTLVNGSDCGSKGKAYEHNGRSLPAPLCIECLDIASKIKKQWLNEWTEAQAYFDLVNNIVDADGEAVHYASGAIRGGLSFTAGCNSLYSAPAAHGSKISAYRVQKECFDKKSPLYGSRMVAFIHDELVCEHPLNLAHDCAIRIEDIMVSTMREFTPDVKVIAEPALMFRMSKSAEPCFDANGRLVPFDS